MGSEVYANGMEVSGKASTHQVIASMPDVCLSPPSPPAGPVPIPYPNFAQASDTTDGSKTVMAGGKEINLKGQSKYKKSTGDEAATKSLGMGVISHNITGPVKHKAGSFDVKVEGAAVVRHLDLTTGNHSNPGDGDMAPDGAGMAPPGGPPTCEELSNKNKNKRERAGHGEEPTTITHGTYTPPTGSPANIWSSSSPLAGINDPGFCSGLGRVKTGTQLYRPKGAKRRKRRKVTESESSNLCPEATTDKGAKGFKYTHTKSSGGQGSHSGHTESRIIEDIFAGKLGAVPPGGKLRLSIDWNRQNENTKEWLSDKTACPNCQRLICAAMICGLEIELCNEKNTPVEQDKDDCKDDLSGKT